MSKTSGSLYIITGPSGAGKGAVLSRVLNTLENVFYSISATTRKARPGEINGEDYYFISQSDFEEMIAKNELLEYAEYVDNYYGTPEGPVNQMLADGKDVILEIEVQGALIVKEKRPDAILVFIVPPSFEVLEARLRNRRTEPDDVINRRLQKARSECKHMDGYDYIIVNDNLDVAVKNLSSVILAARCRSSKVEINLV